MRYGVYDWPEIQGRGEFIRPGSGRGGGTLRRRRAGARLRHGRDELDDGLRKAAALRAAVSQGRQARDRAG